MCPCARFAWPSTLPLLTEVVICGRKTKHIPGRPYLMWKKCSDRAAQLKQDLFTARTLQLKLFGFFSCFPRFFCWMWDKLSCFLTPHQTGALLLQFEISFLKKKCWFPNCCRISWDVTCVNHLKIHCEQRPCVAKHAWKRGCRAEAPSWSASLEVNEITFFEGFANIRGFLEPSHFEGGL